MNNYKALKFHIAICILACFSYGFSDKFINKNITSINVLLMLMMYILSGFLMENLSLKFENFKSISLIFILGSIIWIISAVSTGFSTINSNPNWMVYGFYTFYFLPLLDIFNINNPFVYLISSLIPTILIWIGIELQEVIGIRKGAENNNEL